MPGKRRSLATLASDVDDAPLLIRELEGQGERRTVPLYAVSWNPLNPRPEGEDDEIARMADSMREHGLLQPLVVCSRATYLARRPGQASALGDADWVVLLGNRRLRAAHVAGLAAVDILVNEELAARMWEVVLVENGQRLDLPPLKEAEAIAEALREEGLSQAELARRVGKSRAFVTQRLALLRLVPELRTLLEEGRVTVKQARHLGDLPEEVQRAVAAAGPPYVPARVNPVNSRSPRSIRVTSPAAAAEALRDRFTPEERAELIRLLLADA